MTKAKFDNLTKYASDLISKSKADIPSKHVDHPQQYKNFLANELRIVQTALAAAVLEGKK